MLMLVCKCDGVLSPRVSSYKSWETWVSIHKYCLCQQSQQSLSSLGSEMYMAFGVKEKSGGRSPAAGDVVVGWINSQTGRGGLDDYFLSGSHTCSDGAESCPDTSRAGGQNNVEMLNSVSRDNYTMITFKRSVASVKSVCNTHLSCHCLFIRHENVNVSNFPFPSDSIIIIDVFRTF